MTRATRNAGPSQLCGHEVAVKQKSRLLTQVHLLRAHPLLVVEARLNGRGPLRIAIDTGASVTVITPQTAKAVRIGLPEKQATAVSASSQVATFLYKLDRLEIGGLSVRSLDIAVVNLAAVNRATHLGISGILGYNFLHRYKVVLDYPRGLVEFYGC